MLQMHFRVSALALPEVQAEIHRYDLFTCLRKEKCNLFPTQHQKDRSHYMGQKLTENTQICFRDTVSNLLILSCS